MSGKKESNTPNQNPNSTLRFKKTNTLRRFSPNVANKTSCNQTMLGSSSSENPFLKSSISTCTLKNQVIEAECDLTYNDYLQSLLKYEIINKKIKEQEKILQGQILLQENNVSKRKIILEKIQNDTELLIKKEEIVKMIHTLEENIKSMQNIYANYQTEQHIDAVNSILQARTEILVLKNVTPITTQEQYNNLINSLKKLASSCEKIVHCGRDFEGVNKLAEQCRNLLHIEEKIKESLISLSSMETHAINNVLQKLSDGFAKQYENID